MMLAAAVLAWAALAGTTRADDARIISEKQLTNRVIELTIDTPAFATPTKVQVDLPVGYRDDPSRRWPVTLFTSGTTNGPAWFNDYLGGEKLSENHPAIIVSPDGKAGYWSDWYNGGAFGPPRYETYVIDQLIPLIDARFRTIGDRGHRAVFGISMGGFGAMMLAARHPELFSAAASLSGAVDSNLPAPAAVLTISSMFDGAPPDAIFGPRATQEVRWHGHNPTDLAANLRDLDLQIRTANGTPNPSIGEHEVPSSTACVAESVVRSASVSLHQKFDSLGIGHVWKDYGAGCHTGPTFEREVTDTLTAFERVFADPPKPPPSFEFRSIEPDFDVYGWHVKVDPARALEFLHLRAGRNGVTLEGSGKTTVTTPPWYRGLKKVDVNGRPVTPRPDGRLNFGVNLGAAHTVQQYTPGASSTVAKRRVSLAPHAVIRISKAKRVRRGIRVCARVIGGNLPRARIRAGRRVVKTKLGPKKTCRLLRLHTKPRRVTIRGKDRFGHRVAAKATLHPRR
jgi:S-formylglutathione hydrolase FrmB